MHNEAEPVKSAACVFVAKFLSENYRKEYSEEILSK